MRTLELREGDSPLAVILTAGEARALNATKAVVAIPTGSDGVWTVAPTTRVGAITVMAEEARRPLLEVHIAPKVDISRLVFLMGYSRFPHHWQEGLVTLDPSSGLPEALARTLAHVATRALEQGALKGYVRVDRRLPVLRGRLRESDQMHRFGLGLPLEVRFDEYSIDIAENQILLAGVLKTLRMPGIPAPLRTTLQRLRVLLADVSVPVGRPVWTPSRLNARYIPALTIAEMILDGDSFELESGGLRVCGFLLNMAQVFEDFVCVALRDALTRVGSGSAGGGSTHLRGNASLQFRTHLDSAHTVPIRPDFVWLRAGRPMMVADAKYKAQNPSGFPQADLYQMLAYCTVLGLDTGHLIYAKGEADAGTVEVVGSGTRVVRHVLDLEASPSELLAQLDGIARAILGEEDNGSV